MDLTHALPGYILCGMSLHDRRFLTLEGCVCRSLVGTHNSAGLGRGVNMKDSEIWTSGDRQTKRTSQEDMAQVLRAGVRGFLFQLSTADT